MALMARCSSSIAGTATGRNGCSDHQSRPARRCPTVCAGSVPAHSMATTMPLPRMPQTLVDRDSCMTLVCERDCLQLALFDPSYSDCWSMYATNPSGVPRQRSVAERFAEHQFCTTAILALDSG